MVRNRVIDSLLTRMEIHSLDTQVEPFPLEHRWFCIRTQLKREHIAASNLRQAGVALVFNPQIRIRKSTRRGMVWFTESLFPTYIFARMNLAVSGDQVRFSFGVRTIVNFGGRVPTIEDDVMEDLVQRFGQSETPVVPNDPRPNDSVNICRGAFAGSMGTVLAYMPASQRVHILLEFLGRSTKVDVPRESVELQAPRYGEIFA